MIVVQICVNRWLGGDQEMTTSRLSNTPLEASSVLCAETSLCHEMFRDVVTGVIALGPGVSMGNTLQLYFIGSSELRS